MAYTRRKFIEAVTAVIAGIFSKPYIRINGEQRRPTFEPDAKFSYAVDSFSRADSSELGPDWVSPPSPWCLCRPPCKPTERQLRCEHRTLGYGECVCMNCNVTLYQLVWWGYKDEQASTV